MKKLLLCSVWLIMAAPQIFAQTAFSGVVTDIQDEPIPGAIVSIANSPGAKDLYITETDSLGAYRIHNCPETFALEIIAFGHEAYRSEVLLSEYPENIIKTKLKWTDVGEVVVRGKTKPKMVLNGNKFVVEKLENSPFAKGNNAFTFLRYLPILDVPVFGGDISVVGGGKATLQINGRRSAMSMEEFLKNTPTESIERIEIIATPGSEYSAGSQQTSIINFIMKKRPDEGMKYSLYLQDAYENVNSYNGAFNINYSGKKTFAMVGVSTGNSRTRLSAKENYRFYDTNSQSLILSDTYSKNYWTNIYYTIEHELNKRNTIGMGFSTSFANKKSTNDATTLFSRLSDGYIDSTYLSAISSVNPLKWTNLYVSLNYTLKTDDKGSALLTDIDYYHHNPTANTLNLFDKVLNSGTIRERDFIQRENTSLDGSSATVRYNHVFNPKTKLNSGISLTGALTDYDFFQGNNNGSEYVSDPNYTNNFTYDDFTFAAYTSLQRNWSDKFSTTLGLRLESYHARGKQQTTGEKILRNETDLYPSLTVNYLPSQNHVLSLNITRSVFRPNYSYLNPYRRYISPASYSVGNPNFKSASPWEGYISYNLFSDFWIGVSSFYIKNTSNYFSTPDENGMIKVMLQHYDSHFEFEPYATVSQSLFNSYLNLRGTFKVEYNSDKGTVENIDIDATGWSYNFNISGDIIFSKKAGVSLYTRYWHRSLRKFSNGVTPAHSSLQAVLSKRFANSSIQIGFSKILTDTDEFLETPTYGFNVLRPNYWVWNASYSLTFGNTKARNVKQRTSSDISKRL